MNKDSVSESASGGGLGKAVPERRYRNPPVLEALCEIYFADSMWDETVPGAFYERIKDDFPEKRQRVVQEAHVELGTADARAGVRLLPPWMQFVSLTGDRMIQVAEKLLVVNQLRPYPHFEGWQPVVHRALQIYRELAQPKSVARLGLRYINQIVIPGAKVRMEDYFVIYPNLPPKLGDTHHSFLVRVEVPQERGHKVLVTFGSAPIQQPGKDEQVFMLDLYDILQAELVLEEIDVDETVRVAHDNIVLAFESSITSRLRDLFGLEGRP